MKKNIKRIATLLLVATIILTTILTTILSITTVSANGLEKLNIDTVDGVTIYNEILYYSKEHRPKIAMTPEYITIHNTGNSDYGADADMHSRYLSGNTQEEYVSWHYTVDNTKIIQHLPLNEVGYHAGDGGNGTGNLKSIAIEICENVDGNYAEAEKHTVKLVAELLYELNMDISKVMPHKHWSSKECPENLLYGLKGSLGWDNFIAEIQKELTNIIVSRTQIESIEALTMKTGMTTGILFYTTDNTYSLTKEGYSLKINSEDQQFNNLLINLAGTSNINYKQSVIVDKSSYEIEDASSEFNDLIKNKDAQFTTTSGTIFDVNTKKFKSTGLTVLNVSSEKESVRFIVYNYIKQNPIISTNIESFIKNTSAFNLLLNTHPNIEWKIENEDIAVIKNNKITTKTTGTTKIIGTIDGISFSRTLIVE